VDGIRRITTNRSELKKMTAHDYEDMLQVSVPMPSLAPSDSEVQIQCAVPVFEGLLPEPHNTSALAVLFELAHWHGLAKLRMHTDTTLALLSEVTTTLGRRLRTFQEETCAAFPTRELQREQVARMRRQEKSTVAAEGGSSQSKAQKQSNSARLPKQLNLSTYKLHSLGDYSHHIRQFGTIDSYSTQPVSFS
jgi:hypothetical protein